ncbi:MAG: PD-(D/E)XK nuclease family protein [Campylobacterota bacterium]|nr:PD-(D/E)XK nuclease family protein [Campylobacterota bacterium]
MSKIEDKYINFFEEVKKFQEKQKKQKQRGLNDYNMVNVVRKENAEVGMHSNVIYSLINPNGLHYQDNLFLQIFIQEVLDIENFGEIISVNAEEATSENRRVDFTIKSSNYYIGIEMKIDACDLENQISHYFDDLSKKADDDNEQKVIIYYLTKDGKEASSYSCNDIHYKKISFDNHILNWIEQCQYEVRNITNLNEAFENYKDIVKKITNKHEGKVMKLKDMLKEKDNFSLAKDIHEAYIESSTELEKTFWDNILNALKKENITILNHSSFDFESIKKARLSSGPSSEIWIDFELYNINSDNKVILKIGSSNWAKGIFITIAKLHNGTWVSGHKNHEQEIINIINTLSTFKFTKPNWAYGLSEFKEYQLRNENLTSSLDKVDEFIEILMLFINDLKTLFTKKSI